MYIVSKNYSSADAVAFRSETARASVIAVFNSAQCQLIYLYCLGTSKETCEL